MPYICIKSFTATNGYNFHLGQRITEREFFLLWQSDREKFREIQKPRTEDLDLLHGSSYNYQQSNFDTPSYGSDWNSDSSNDSSNFDYGGGDSGGAGATGDFDTPDNNY